MKRLHVTAAFALAMILIIVSSNVLVQYPLGEWLTWGAITYPFAFLVVDLANRYYGPRTARRIVCIGFVVALGDLGVKLAIALFALLPFRVALALVRPSA